MITHYLRGAEWARCRTEFVSPAERDAGLLDEDHGAVTINDNGSVSVTAFKKNTRGVYLIRDGLKFSEGFTVACVSQRTKTNGAATEFEIGKHEVGPLFGFDANHRRLWPRIADSSKTNGTRQMGPFTFSSDNPRLLFQVTGVGRTIHAVVLDLTNSVVVFQQELQPDWFTLEAYYDDLQVNLVTTANVNTTKDDPVEQTADWLYVGPAMPPYWTDRMVAQLGW